MKNENSPFQNNTSIKINGKLLDFSTARIMGIINLTPDSFYDGGSLKSEKDTLEKVETFIAQGAEIVDIGAFSSRPNSKLIPYEEERKRLIPILKLIIQEFENLIISVDTTNAKIAEEVMEEGACIINDISAGDIDPEMIKLIGKHNYPYVLNHMQGVPEHMQDNPKYEHVSKEVFQYFTGKLQQLHLVGASNLIIDPGFGFGKNLADNYKLLKDLQFFKFLDCPILVGISRKGMIQKVVQKNASEALNGSTIAHVLALMNGANILRVHDVLAAKEAIEIVDIYQKQ